MKNIQESKEYQEVEGNQEKILPLIRKRKNDKKKKYADAQNSGGWMKPVMITVFSAVLVGSILGFFMLNIFTNVGPSADTDGQTTNNIHANQLSKTDKQKSLASLQEMQAFVIQGGVFSELENAKGWAVRYEEEGLSPVVFERDGQYFLFVGIAGSEEVANQLAVTLEEKKIEVYVKEWRTEQGQLELNADEKDWVTSFQQLWQETLTTSSSDGSVTFDKWNNLLDDFPTESEVFVKLAENIQEFKVQGGNDTNLEGMLLSLWETYERILLQRNVS